MEQEERIFELNTKQDFLVGVCGVVIVRETLFFYFSWLCRHNTKYSRTSTANQKRKQATEDMKTFLLGT